MKKIVVLSLFCALLFCACTQRAPAPSPGIDPLPTPPPPETASALLTPPPTAKAELLPSAPVPLPDGEDLTARTRVSYEGAALSELLDGNYETKRAFRNASVLNVSCDTELYALYIIWDLPPGRWHAEAESRQSFGENGFIHEYVTLSARTKELSLILPEGGATICDIYTFSDGEPPDWVQTWLPPWEEADLLVLPTHADDEHLYFGGVLPYYAGELGLRVQLAYLTNHWNAPPRPHELLNGLWTVGVRAYPVISAYNDRKADTLQEAMAIYPLDTVLDYQVTLLRRFKPLVVVGHDINGEYGHGVHRLNAHAIQSAVALAADSANYPESARQHGVWDTPKLYLHLYKENEIIMNWDIPLENFGGATAFEMAVAGYACHKSQHQWSFAVRQGDSPYDCRRFGLVRSLVGADVEGGDLLEHIQLR